MKGLYFSEFRLIRELSDGTRLLRIPRMLQEPMGVGIEQCSCDYCKTHPDHTPSWDTLAIPPITTKHGFHCWTVHYDLRLFGLLRVFPCAGYFLFQCALNRISKHNIESAALIAWDVGFDYVISMRLILRAIVMPSSILQFSSV